MKDLAVVGVHQCRIGPVQASKCNPSKRRMSKWSTSSASCFRTTNMEI